MSDLTWPELRDAVASDVGVVVPVGAIEQHGYHLPLATDAILARELAHAIAEPCDLVVAPSLSYGYRSRPLSGGGAGFPGTTSLSARSFIGVLEDVLCELIRHGFRRVVVLNWHFENTNLVYEAAWLAHERRPDAGARILVHEGPGEDVGDDVLAAMFPGGFPGWALEHAAIMETSLMLHLRPELVLFERAVDDQPPRRASYDVVPPPDDFIAPSGTLWKATQATVEKGRVYWEAVVRDVISDVQTELPSR